MNDTRVMNRTSEAQIRAVASALGPGVKVVRGRFAVNTGDNGSAAIFVGACRGDALTDRPEGCEAIAATVIVVPHVGVKLPAGTSVEHFMANSDSLFSGEAIADALATPERST